MQNTVQPFNQSYVTWNNPSPSKPTNKIVLLSSTPGCIISNFCTLKSPTLICGNQSKGLYLCRTSSSSFSQTLIFHFQIEMTSTIIGLLSPPLLVHGRKTHFRKLHKVPVSAFGESQKRISVVVKATGESSESSLSIVKSVQNIWDKSEDRIALVGLGFTGIVALWASTNLVAAIDKLPLIPSAFELIGILFSSWFVYRYLLFKPDREELSKIIKSSISKILDQ